MYGRGTAIMIVVCSSYIPGRSVNRAGIYKVNIAFSEAEKWLQLIFYHLFYSASVKEDTCVVFGVWYVQCSAMTE